jgi:NAD(P)H-hydrate epimerase
MKIFPSIQIKELDAYTIEHEPIASIDLMERAATAFVNTLVKRWSDDVHVVVFAGPGNNGGDALAIARILCLRKYNVKAFLFNPQAELSPDCQENVGRLANIAACDFTQVTQRFVPPTLDEDTLVIDGLFGTGLNKPLQGGYAAVIKYINSSCSTVVSIDVPSGLMSEDNTFNLKENIIKADYTFSLQFPKLAFLFSENEQYVGECKVLDIGLSKKGIEEIDTIYSISEIQDILRMIRPRGRFSHKGTYGHGLLIAGSYGMAGSSVLAARAALRTGIGLLTVHAPIKNNDIVQISVPEAIVNQDINQYYFSNAEEADKYQAVAIGPGLGTSPDTVEAFIAQLKQTQSPMVLDADAINILAENHSVMNFVPVNSILTPHPKEFQRLVGRCNNTYEMLLKASDITFRRKLYIILKGAWTAVITPDGDIHFNPTGNPGMATAGSGDVLTGILLSLLAQGYTSEEAAILGTFLHGQAGDIAEASMGMRGMTASDIVDKIPEAWKTLIDVCD